MSFTMDDLRRVMRECAGEDESADFGGDIAEVDFESLGYDSLALMETASRIERELHIALPEEEVGEATTPAQFVRFVNNRMTQVA
jgi:minimal PKS acyl carrier protein